MESNKCEKPYCLRCWLIVRESQIRIKKQSFAPNTQRSKTPFLGPVSLDHIPTPFEGHTQACIIPNSLAFDIQHIMFQLKQSQDFRAEWDPQCFTAPFSGISKWNCARIPVKLNLHVALQLELKKRYRNRTSTQVLTSNTECLTQHTNVCLAGHAGLNYLHSVTDVPVMQEVWHLFGSLVHQT